MSPRVKLLSVVVILGLGLGLAMLFPRRSDLGEQDERGDALPLRDSLTSHAATPAATGAKTGGGSANSAPRRTHQPLRPAWASTGPAADHGARDAASIVSSADSAASSPPPGVPPSTTAAHWPSSTGRAPPMRTHTILDGDTLEGLAQRYLGRMDRASQIFQLNRDRLQLESPDLLPIGGVLHIPPQAEVPAVRSSPPTSQAALQIVPIPAGTFSRPAAGNP